MSQKKILIVEDTLQELSDNGKELERAGFQVSGASSTSKADASIEKHEGYFDCVIVDLNMSNKRLPDNLKKKTHGGSLTGWIWLYHIAREKLNSKCVIILYSEFISELKKHLETATMDENSYYNNIVPIPKTAAVNNSSYLVEKVEEQIGKGVENE